MTSVTPIIELVSPLSISVPEAALADMRRRLADTRLAEQETLSDFSRGVPLYHEVATGGDFAAREQPNLLTEELRAGFRSLRELAV